jgi:hypothetical protein
MRLGTNLTAVAIALTLCTTGLGQTRITAAKRGKATNEFSNQTLRSADVTISQLTSGKPSRLGGFYFVPVKVRVANVGQLTLPPLRVNFWYRNGGKGAVYTRPHFVHFVKTRHVQRLWVPFAMTSGDLASGQSQTLTGFARIPIASVGSKGLLRAEAKSPLTEFGTALTNNYSRWVSVNFQSAEAGNNNGNGNANGRGKGKANKATFSTSG